MDVRIGIADSPQIIEIDLENDTDRDALKAAVEAAISGASSVLWVTDKKGKEVAVPSVKIGFVEVGTPDAERKIGFGA